MKLVALARTAAPRLAGAMGRTSAIGLSPPAGEAAHTDFDAGRAEAEGGALPPLLLAAERVAASVAQGVHGRRRVGQGDSFWQFRPFAAGDSAARIDWRQTARSNRATVREMEWEAAQTGFLWRDASPSMAWRSRASLPTKAGRAELLLLALAALLLRAGEQVRLSAAAPFRGRAGLDALSRALRQCTTEPDPDAIPRHANAVLIGDFLSPVPAIETMLRGLSARQVTGVLIQVLDPAELSLPYAGRVRFHGLEGEAPALLARVEAVRPQYLAALAAQREAIARIAEAARFGVVTHRTDEPPRQALTTAHQMLGRA